LRVDEIIATTGLEISAVKTDDFKLRVADNFTSLKGRARIVESDTLTLYIENSLYRG